MPLESNRNLGLFFKTLLRILTGDKMVMIVTFKKVHTSSFV